MKVVFVKECPCTFCYLNRILNPLHVAAMAKWMDDMIMGLGKETNDGKNSSVSAPRSASKS